MSLSETDLIERYFRDLGSPRNDVALGIGDDAALLRPAAGSELVLTTDALIEGVHFLPGAAARSLGHRALAVNLSDIAAMGATPSWALLSLNLPQANESWLAEFAAGFGALARRHGVALVGGNLSRGALSITVQMAGQVAAARALRRAGASAGDALYVSGSIGDAAAGLRLVRGELSAGGAEAEYLRARFEYPTPRVELGEQLLGLASACIDVSDGLSLDAQRLLQACGCAATLELERLPLSAPLRALLRQEAPLLALTGGEDYELCFAAPAAAAPAIEALAARTGCPISRIGQLHAGQGLMIKSADSVKQFSPGGFDHFSV